MLWPLFHYLLPLSAAHGGRFNRSYWQAYVSVNKVRYHNNAAAIAIVERERERIMDVGVFVLVQSAAAFEKKQTELFGILGGLQVLVNSKAYNEFCCIGKQNRTCPSFAKLKADNGFCCIGKHTEVVRHLEWFASLC
jgi:hypothetical protein